MVRVSWGGDVVIADLAHVAGDGGNGGDGDEPRPLPITSPSSSVTTPSSTPAASSTHSEASTISPAPTMSPLPFAPTAVIEMFTDTEESLQSNATLSSNHKSSLKDDTLDSPRSASPMTISLSRTASPMNIHFSRTASPLRLVLERTASPKPMSIEQHLVKEGAVFRMADEDDNNNGFLHSNGSNGESNGTSNGVSITSDEYRRFLLLKGSPMDSGKEPPSEALKKELKTGPARSSADDEMLKKMDRMLATLSDMDDDLEPMEGASTSTSTESEPDDAEQQKVLLTDKWRLLFDKFDMEGFGEIPWPDFRRVLVHPEFIAAVDVAKREQLATKALTPTTTAITFQDFVNVMSGKRSRSFKCAVHHLDLQVRSENDFQLFQEPTPFKKMVQVIASEFLTEERDRKYYADNYKCWPPPFFIITITLIQICVFIYYSVVTGGMSLTGPIPIDSPLIYRPDKRHHIWRFILYAYLHAGWAHLAFNLIVQLIVGIPLEMVHGSARIGCVYQAGVVAGSLGTSVFDANIYLMGASGGVYALLAAHLANVLMNFHNMHFGILRLLGIFILASADVGFAIYDRYAHEKVGLPVSYIAHLMGALAGLTLGYVVLKNFEQRLHKQLLWWVALGAYAACTLFALLFNLLHTYPHEIHSVLL
ncbi:unnamed protein product [Meganyctiphanes norvegica]|uniref:rhomboid protease n=1 Tax=Meganyctiphanes norvegica TaxID=48144 RepID=A0AAV2QB63_MEGNR